MPAPGADAAQAEPPPAEPRRRRWRSRMSCLVIPTNVDELGAEDLVERVDHGLRGRAGPLEVHGLDRFRLVVQEPIRTLLLALADQDLLGLLVEQRPAVEDEVRGDVLRLLS